MPLKPDIALLQSLTAIQFEHPLDVQARKALSSIPLLKEVSSVLSEWFSEGKVYRYHIANSVRVSASQYPSLYSQYVKMARVLNLQKLPELFVSNESDVNAYAIGQKNYLIVVSAPLIDLMTEDELLAVIAHELGHIKCEHMLYSSVAEILHLMGGQLFNSIPIPLLGQALESGLLLTLMEWYRTSELSCDRAALLATQNPQAVCTMLAKFAGYSHNLKDPINIDGILQQAGDYEDTGDESAIGKIIRLRVLMNQTHPYPIVRVKEIHSWAQSDQYRQLIGAAPLSAKHLPTSDSTAVKNQGDRFLPINQF